MNPFERIVESRRAAKALDENVGEGSQLAETVQVYGWKNVRIGNHGVLCDDVLINAMNCPSDEPTVVIGDFCFIGRRNFLNAGESLIIGDYCVTGTDCHFLGSDHQGATPVAPYITSASALGGSTSLGPNVWLGARVTVMKGVKIGFGSIVSAASVVTSDVPPLSMAGGYPAQVTKRFDLAINEWVPVENLPADFDATLPTEADYLAGLRQSHPSVRMPVRAIGKQFGDL